MTYRRTTETVRDTDIGGNKDRTKTGSSREQILKCYFRVEQKIQGTQTGKLSPRCNVGLVEKFYVSTSMVGDGEWSIWKDIGCTISCLKNHNNEYFERFRGVTRDVDTERKDRRISNQSVLLDVQGPPRYDTVRKDGK